MEIKIERFTIEEEGGTIVDANKKEFVLKKTKRKKEDEK